MKHKLCKKLVNISMVWPTKLKSFSDSPNCSLTTHLALALQSASYQHSAHESEKKCIFNRRNINLHTFATVVSFFVAVWHCMCVGGHILYVQTFVTSALLRIENKTKNDEPDSLETKMPKKIRTLVTHTHDRS